MLVQSVWARAYYTAWILDVAFALSSAPRARIAAVETTRFVVVVLRCVSVCVCAWSCSALLLLLLLVVLFVCLFVCFVSSWIFTKWASKNKSHSNPIAVQAYSRFLTVHRHTNYLCTCTRKHPRVNMSYDSESASEDYARANAEPRGRQRSTQTKINYQNIPKYLLPHTNTPNAYIPPATTAITTQSMIMQPTAINHYVQE